MLTLYGPTIASAIRVATLGILMMFGVILLFVIIVKILVSLTCR